MSGPPPPFGYPWHVDVGQNPNINRDPPPPMDGPLPLPSVGVVLNGHGSGPSVVPLGPPPAYPPLHPPHPPHHPHHPHFALPHHPYFAHPPPPAPSSAPAAPPPQEPPFIPGGPPLYQWSPSNPSFPPPPVPGSGVSPLGFGMLGGLAGMPPPFAAGGMPWAMSAGVMPGMTGGMMSGMMSGMPGMIGGLGSMVPGMMGGMGMFPGGMWGPNGFERAPPAIIDGGAGPAPGPQLDPTVKPGGDLAGHTVIQPAETTAFMRIHSQQFPWETAGMPLPMEPLQVDSGWTVNRLITALRLPSKECQGWAVTECLELGNGRWAKGIQFHHGQQQATEQTMGMILDIA
ncbi:hypothetical protein B0J11DRAFT_509070 [Dendryphion nanum]|uniref:Uncharacterized protein n=1 Tax=Dendryphion nanum TaxID=256645 RepID=A0A9P9DGF5_9PLEO|nr:hypothetical protein B0J11DRAFT_509070 [Dendryphion nanum]